MTAPGVPGVPGHPGGRGALASHSPRSHAHCSGARQSSGGRRRPCAEAGERVRLFALAPVYPGGDHVTSPRVIGAVTKSGDVAKSSPRGAGKGCPATFPGGLDAPGTPKPPLGSRRRGHVAMQKRALRPEAPPRPRHPRSCAQWGRATRPGGSVLTFHEQVLGSVMCSHVVSESRASEASWF